MNEMQRKALIAVGVAILAMLIFPPYRIGSVSGVHILETGYDWLFSLPDRATVDVATLIVEWLGALIVGAIAFLVLKGKGGGE